MICFRAWTVRPLMSLHQEIYRACLSALWPLLMVDLSACFFPGYRRGRQSGEERAHGKVDT